MFHSSANGSLSRRRFLHWSQAAMATLGALPLFGRAAEAATPAKPAAGGHDPDDYYAKLNVTRVINARGTFTALTAAVMPLSVQRAVAKAALHPVHLPELQTNAGAYIAQKLKCEAALVSAGASSALTLATAAAIQGANPGCKPTDIPLNIGPGQKFPKFEVIVQRSHRYEYDHAMYLCGARVVEVTTMDDYRKAIAGPNVVMTNFFNSSRSGQISREDWLSVAHDHGIPCHLDAAADMPPIENLWKYTGMGFDFVCFSGGKGIRGPQNAGLLLGKKKWIDLAAQNDAPNQAVGRGMKVAKEQIVGMVAAIDWLLTQNDAAMEKEWERRCNVVLSAVKTVIPDVQHRIDIEAIANHAPIITLTYDPAVIGISGNDLAQTLRTQKPSIEVASSRPNAIAISTWMLLPGEEITVANELRRHFHAAKAAKAKA